jgi:HSP20 family protein
MLEHKTGRRSCESPSKEEHHTMQLMRYRPSSAFGDFDRLLSAFDSPDVWAPSLDVYEVDGTLTIRAALPGFDAEQLDVTLEDGMLAITGSRSFEVPDGAKFHLRELADGSFGRKVRVGDGYDTESVSASYHDGILTVSLAKRPEVLPRKIDIVTN